MATLDKLVVEIKAETSQLQRDLKKVTASMENSRKSAVGMGKAFNTAAKAAIAFGVAMVGQKISQTIIKYEKLSASLITFTGSAEQASKEFDRLNTFAATTPFQLTEVVGAFVKMKSLGLDPSEEALRSFGDTALAMGTSLNQMIEAVADASTFEFERLKEFGIIARQESDKVTFTFKGVKTEVDKTASSVTGFLKSIGLSEGIAGGAARQMDTLGGAVSNLNQNFETMLVAIGDAGVTKFLKEAALSAGDFTKSISAIAKEVGGFLDEINAESDVAQLKNLNMQIKATKDGILESRKELEGGGFFSGFNKYEIDASTAALKDFEAERLAVLERIKEHNKPEEQNTDGGDVAPIDKTFGPITDDEMDNWEKRKELIESLAGIKIKSAEDLANAEHMIELKKNKMLFDSRAKSASLAINLLKTVFGENKAFAIADLALRKAIAISENKINTELAAMASMKYDPTGALAASIRVQGAISTGLIAATGIAEAANILGGDSGGGGASSSSGGSAVSSSEQSQQQQILSPSRTININVDEDSLVTPRVMIELLNKGLEDGNQIVLNGSAL